MPQATAGLDVAAVQKTLAADGLDAWLLYDFHGLNPIASEIAGVGHGDGHLATRRWFYLIPSSGEPRGLVHAIERGALDRVPGRKTRYAGRDELEAGLRELLHGVRRVAMEYSPRCAIPYISRVDAGTVELVRQFGVEIVSSGDLVQRFATIWDEADLDTHKRASDALYRIKDRAFDAVASRLRSGTATAEYDIQRLMTGWFRDEGLVSDSPPIVAAQENAGNPHYMPTASACRPIRPGEIVLLDLWGKLDREGSVFADITWVGYTGARVPERYEQVFDAVAAARDAAVSIVKQAVAEGRDLRGWEVDRAASSVLRERGFAANILHRTGHSLGESVHGNGVNMDDYETHDDRRLLSGAGFTIEPGLYFDDFGVRSEINMTVRGREASVTGPVQGKIVAVV
jgi:Xaa-Pro aminopeptidase